MKNKKRKSSILILILMMVFFCIGTDKVFADGTACYAEIGNNNKKIAIGEEFIYDVGTMGVSVNLHLNDIYYVIEYNSDVLEVVNINKKAASAYNGWTIETENETYGFSSFNTLNIHAYTDDPSKSYNSISAEEFVKIAYVKFKVKATDQKSTSIELQKKGSSYSGIVTSGDDYDDHYYTADCYNSQVTVVNIYAKDSNASLTSLKVNNGELSPKFNANTTSYNVAVDNNVDTIQIDGTCGGTNCKLSGTGLKKLEVGENKFKITVTSEKGTTKNYTVTVNRREKDEAYLQKLVIKNGDLYPNFNSEIRNYIVNVPNETAKLDIEYMTNNDKVNKVDIAGNDLKVGKNYITITVKNEEKKVEQTYEILAIRASAPVKKDNTTSKINIYKILTFVFIGIALAELAIILIKRKDIFSHKKHHNK